MTSATEIKKRKIGRAFAERAGLYKNEKMADHEVAAALGISRQAVRRLEELALYKMYKAAEEHALRNRMRGFTPIVVV